MLPAPPMLWGHQGEVMGQAGEGDTVEQAAVPLMVAERVQQGLS